MKAQSTFLAHGLLGGAVASLLGGTVAAQPADQSLEEITVTGFAN